MRGLALLAGDNGGHAAILQPAEQPAQLGAEDGVIGQPGEQRLEGVEDDALGADGIDGVPEPDEQPFEIVFAGLLDLAALDVDVVQHDLLLRCEVLAESKPSERTLAVSSAAFSSNIMNTPGSPNCVAPRTRNSMASIVLPQPAVPQISVGRPAGTRRRLSHRAPGFRWGLWSGRENFHVVLSSTAVLKSSASQIQRRSMQAYELACRRREFLM